jgi:hypothetical protein
MLIQEIKIMWGQIETNTIVHTHTRMHREREGYFSSLTDEKGSLFC